MKRTFSMEAEVGNEFRTEDFIIFYIDDEIAMIWFADAFKLVIHLDRNGLETLSNPSVINDIKSAVQALLYFTEYFSEIL